MQTRAATVARGGNLAVEGVELEGVSGVNDRFDQRIRIGLEGPQVILGSIEFSLCRERFGQSGLGMGIRLIERKRALEEQLSSNLVRRKHPYRPVRSNVEIFEGEIEYAARHATRQVSRMELDFN